MKKAKKYTALLLAVLLMVAILTACGGGTKGSAPETQAPAPPSEAAQPPSEEESPGTESKEPAKPEVIVSYPIDTDVQELSIWLGMPPFIYNNVDITDYGTTNLVFQEAEAATGIHMNVTALPTSTEREQYQIMITGGDYCDIMSKSSNYAGGADAGVADGVLLELSEYLETYMPDYYEQVMTDSTYVKYITTDEGNIVDIIGKSPGNPLGGIIRGDWLEALDMEVPVTYEDYYNVLKAFKTEFSPTEPIAYLNGGIPYGNSLTSGFGVDAYLNNMGVSYDESFYVVDGQVKFGLAEPGFKEYLEMANKWYSEGLINPNFINHPTTMFPDLTEAISSGKAGIWYGGDDYFDDDYKNIVADPNYKAVALTDPVKNVGDTLHTGEVAMSRGRPAGMMVTISAQSECPEVVMMYLNWFFTEDGNIAANYGKEGYTFNYAEDGSVIITDVIAAPDNGLMVFAAKAIYTAWALPYNEDPNRWASLLNDNQKGLATVWNSNRDCKWLYNGTLTSEEGEKFNVLYADINTLCLESVAKFITGERPVAEFDSFVKDMYDLGLQTCIDLKQAAYERYLAR